MIAPEVSGEDPEYQLTIQQGGELVVDDQQPGKENISNMSTVMSLYS